MDKAFIDSDSNNAEDDEINLWNVLTPLDPQKYKNFDDYIEKKYKGKIKTLQHQPKRPMVVAFHHFSKGYEDLKRWIKVLHEAAQKYEDDSVAFALADYKDDTLLNFERYIQYERRSYPYSSAYCTNAPTLFGIDDKERAFRFVGYVTVENIKRFADKLLSGIFYTSEPIPTINNNLNNLIKVAVADNFDEVVWQSQKDIFLILYSPHCSYSEKFLENASQLANALRDDEHIEIVQMNSKANYIDINLKRGHNPICHFIPRSNKRSYLTQKIRPRNLQELIHFVAKNATDELKHFDREGNKKVIER